MTTPPDGISTVAWATAAATKAGADEPRPWWYSFSRGLTAFLLTFPAERAGNPNLVNLLLFSFK